MSQCERPCWEVLLASQHMNNITGHSLITIPDGKGGRVLYDGEHQADVSCPVYPVGRVLRPSITGNLALTKDVPTTVRIETYKESGTVIVDFAFKSPYSDFIGRPVKGLQTPNTFTSDFGDPESVDMGFKNMTAVIRLNDGLGIATYRKERGGCGTWSGLVPEDVAALAFVGIYAFSSHRRKVEQQASIDHYKNSQLYPVAG